MGISDAKKRGAPEKRLVTRKDHDRCAPLIRRLRRDPEFEYMLDHSKAMVEIKLVNAIEDFWEKAFTSPTCVADVAACMEVGYRRGLRLPETIFKELHRKHGGVPEPLRKRLR